MECHPYLSLSQKCSEELICNKKTVGSTPHDDTCVRGSLWRLPNSECGGWSIQSLKQNFHQEMAAWSSQVLSSAALLLHSSS